MKYLRVLGIAAGALLGMSVVAAASDSKADPILSSSSSAQVYTLPAGLIEISGLAAGPDNTVYGHNDEHGIVYQIDVETGEIGAAFALGNPTLERDLEGIAVYDGRIYLVSSHGYIYEATIGAHQSRVKYNVYDTGIGDLCETEGLASLGGGEFLIVCKKPRTPDYEGRLLVFKWSINSRLPVTGPAINAPIEPWLEAGQRRKFQPSAIEITAGGNLMVLSARSRSLFLFDPQGGLLARQGLAKKAHKQAEGLALMPDGSLIVSDEGKGGTPGKISVYQLNGNYR